MIEKKLFEMRRMSSGYLLNSSSKSKIDVSNNMSINRRKESMD
jgi:hypothetical protein